jgi:hypothetical protein
MPVNALLSAARQKRTGQPDQETYFNVNLSKLTLDSKKAEK